MDIRVFKYPSCTVDGHGLQPMSRICLDSKCADRSPVCCMCEFEKHQGHKTLPIKHILKQVTTSSQQIIPADGLSQLQCLRHQFFDSLSKTKRQLMDQIDKLQTKGELYFNLCEQNLYALYSLSQPLTSQIQNDAKLYKKYFTKLLCLIPSEDKKSFAITQKIQELITTYKDRQKKLIQSITNISASFTKTINQLQTMFGKTRGYDARWSQTFKGHKIKISQCLAEQTGMESSGQRFILMNQPLSQTGKTQWSIKVKKFVGWVGLGICLKNAIKTANYHFNYTNIGHGSYLISTNGYTWSHSVKQFNSAYKSFQFTAGDTVTIEYDPQSNKLRFKKNQGSDKYELDIVAPPSGDSYHPCVNLCSTGDAVEIVRQP